MSILRRAISLFMVAVLAVGLTACGSTGANTDADASYREPYKEKDTGNSTNTTDFVDTDGDFDYKTVEWSGPSGYVIVVPAGDSKAKETAEYLQDYYTRVHNVTLKIVTDSSAKKDKEIIIGKTNRTKASKLAEGDIKVSLQGEKLVFEGGHEVTTEAAVKRFTRLLPDVNQAFTFEISTDFVSTPAVTGLEDYEYVWGDEFEDWYDIDYAKWHFRIGMGSYKDAMISTDRDVIDVSDGRLKLHAINYFDREKEGICFKMPYSVATSETMNFLYGYIEIRARVPFFNGVWPSFWGTTATGVYERNPLWHAEVDVFEIFGNENTVAPNIHKWYDAYDYKGIYGADGSHTQYSSATHPKTSYKFENYDKLDTEYHTYGYEWTQKEINMYVDGEKYMTFDIVNSFDLEKDMSMFHEPQYSQFNCHLFTSGNNYKPKIYDENIDLLPACYYIDHYRVYQKKDGKSKIWTDTSGKETANNANRVKEVSVGSAQG